MTTEKQKSIRSGKRSKASPELIKLRRKQQRRSHANAKKAAKVTRVKRNPIVSKAPLFVIQAHWPGYKPLFYQLGSKGVSKPLQGLFTQKRAGASELQKYNAAKVAREILPYLDKRIEWIKVVPA